MSDKKFFWTTITFFVATCILATICFSGVLNNVFPKISFETSAYIGSLTSLTLAISFVLWKNNMKYQSVHMPLVVFYISMWAIFSLMNIASIFITIVSMWYKFNLGTWYLGFITFTIIGVLWFWLLYLNGLKLDEWPLLLTKKIGFYSNVISREINKNADYEEKILRHLSGKINQSNFMKVKMNINKSGIRLSDSFYRKLFMSASKEDKAFIIDLSTKLSSVIRKVRNLDVEWIKENHEKNEQFIYQCWDTYEVQIIFDSEIEKIQNFNIKTQNALINFTLNFINELKEVIDLVQNSYLAIPMTFILQKIDEKCLKYNVTDRQRKNIMPLFLKYSRSLKNDFYSKIIDVILLQYHNKEERNKQLSEILLSQER